MRMHTLFLAGLLALAVAGDVRAEELTVEIEGTRVRAAQGEAEASGELTAAEREVLARVSPERREAVEQVIGHRVLGTPLSLSGTLQQGEEGYGLQLVTEAMSFELEGISALGASWDALDDLRGETVSLSGLVQLSEDEVPPLDHVSGPYFAEPIYTQWPQRRVAKIEVSGLLGSEEQLAGTLQGGRLQVGQSSLRLLGGTARWLRADHDGERMTVKGYRLNLPGEAAFLVSHVQVRVRKWTKLESPSPLGGLSLPLAKSKKARWATRLTYGESARLVAPSQRLYLELKGRSGFVAQSALSLIEPAQDQGGGLIQALQPGE